MFTKNEYRQYFTAIRNADLNMVKHINNITSKISESKIIIEKLETIKKQEEYHLQLSDELFKLVE